MPEETLTVRLKAEIADFVAKLNAVKGQVEDNGKAVKTTSEESAGAMKKGADEMADAQKKTSEATDETTKSTTEQGKQMRENIRDYKLANIEQMQYNQILNMTGNTAQQWGRQLQGSHNLVNTSIAQFTEHLHKATGGLTTYLGAGLQVVGMVIDTYAQYSRLLMMYGMYIAAQHASTEAQVANTAVTGAAIPVQLGLNAAMMANPYVAAAAAIIAVTAAIAAAVIGWQSYTRNQNEAYQKNLQLIDSIDRLKDRMRRLHEGETGQTRDFMAQAEEVYRRMQDVRIKAAAAQALGRGDEAAEYQRQADEMYYEYNLMLKSAELSKGQTSNLQETLATQAKLAKDVANEYYASLDPMEYWMARKGKADETKMRAVAKAYGEAWAVAYSEGLESGMNSSAATSAANRAAKKAAENFEAHSPPQYGPLKDVKIWGQNLAETYGSGMEAGIPALMRSTERMSASIAGRAGSAMGGSGDSYASHVDNRAWNVAPVINVTNKLDLSDPYTAAELARAVSREVQRLQAVS